MTKPTTVETLTLTGHVGAFDINTRYGAKVKNVFDEAGGARVEAWKPDLAAQLMASIGSTIQAEVVTNDDPQYGRSYDVKKIFGVTAAPQGAPVAAPAPQATPAVPAAVIPSETQDQKNLRIMRQSALERALMAFGIAGEDPLLENSSVLELADSYIDYFVNGRDATGREARIAPVVDAAAGPVA